MEIGQLTLHMKTYVHFIIFRHVRDIYKTNDRVRGAEETVEVSTKWRRMDAICEGFMVNASK
jgi:hypothetical protein